MSCRTGTGPPSRSGPRPGIMASEWSHDTCTSCCLVGSSEPANVRIPYELSGGPSVTPRDRWGICFSFLRGWPTLPGFWKGRGFGVLSVPWIQDPHPLKTRKGCGTQVKSFTVKGSATCQNFAGWNRTGGHARRDSTKTKRPARAEWGWPLPVLRGTSYCLPPWCFVGADCF
jgi:hypothetical protein